MIMKFIGPASLLSAASPLSAKPSPQTLRPDPSRMQLNCLDRPRVRFTPEANLVGRARGVPDRAALRSDRPSQRTPATLGDADRTDIPQRQAGLPLILREVRGCRLVPAQVAQRRRP
jgi:hypothetical protein